MADLEKTAVILYDSLGRGPDADIKRIKTALQEARDDALEEAAKVAANWLVVFGIAAPSEITAQEWANGAVKDIADGIRSLKHTKGGENG